MTFPSDPTIGRKFQRLVEIMARLRAPGGCPWDREQTFESIKSYLLEETYEVMEAIDNRDWRSLAEELGDLLLQTVFFAQIAGEEGRFTIADSLDAIAEKLIRRHPHVFADGDAKTPVEVKQRWEEIKRGEDAEKGKTPGRLLDRVPKTLPALMEAQRLSDRAASVGFDWESPDQVLPKLEEELGELAEARRLGGAEEVAHEIGDLLFALVNLARQLDVDAEQALRAANARFRARFGYIEDKLNAQGRLGRVSLEELDKLWEEAKRQP